MSLVFGTPLVSQGRNSTSSGFHATSFISVVTIVLALLKVCPVAPVELVTVKPMTHFLWGCSQTGLPESLGSL
jgi:hypothetical protein